MVKEKLNHILQKHLPSHEVTYCEVEEHNILGFDFKTSGVALKFDSGLEVFGSSSSFNHDPLIFAGYECLERYVVYQQSTSVEESTKNFKFSLSNGIALHDTIEDAQENAYFELLERNEILKSWFYNTPIKIISHSIGNQSAEFSQAYEVLIVDFSTMPDKHVIGYFAFPRTDDFNLVYGFGSARNLKSAIEKAEKEFAMRLGFLWGEKAEENFEEYNTPDFHQEFYLRKENIPIIKEWLFEKHEEKKSCSDFQLLDILYVNITPPDWDYTVIKAIASDSIPLFFGLPPRHLFEFPYRCDIPHPIM